MVSLNGKLEYLIDFILDITGNDLHRSKKIDLSFEEITLILADTRSRLLADLRCRHGDWWNVMRAFDELIQQAEAAP
jgi:hypothetical protein